MNFNEFIVAKNVCQQIDEEVQPEKIAAYINKEMGNPTGEQLGNIFGHVSQNVRLINGSKVDGRDLSAIINSIGKAVNIRLLGKAQSIKDSTNTDYEKLKTKHAEIQKMVEKYARAWPFLIRNKNGSIKGDPKAMDLIRDKVKLNLNADRLDPNKRGVITTAIENAFKNIRSKVDPDFAQNIKNQNIAALKVASEIEPDDEQIYDINMIKSQIEAINKSGQRKKIELDKNVADDKKLVDIHKKIILQLGGTNPRKIGNTIFWR